MKKIFLLTTIIVSFIVLRSHAQATGSTYKTAAGVKFWPGALSVKHFVGKKVALEGLASFWIDGFRFTGLYEWHGNIDGAPGLRWYVGPGAHVGFWSTDWKNRYPGRNANATIGVDGVLGLDYKIKEAPINISLDWQPSVNIAGYNSYFYAWGGLGIRYTFK